MNLQGFILSKLPFCHHYLPLGGRQSHSQPCLELWQAPRTAAAQGAPKEENALWSRAGCQGRFHKGGAFEVDWKG